MYTQFAIRCVIAGLITFVLGHSSSAHAHEFIGQLGAAKRATDVATVTCGTGTGRLFAQAVDHSPDVKPRLSAQIIKGDHAASATARTQFSDDLFSPGIVLNEGAGVYHVLVDKSRAGPKDYTIIVHCQTPGGGRHTSTNIAIVQNQ